MRHLFTITGLVSLMSCAQTEMKNNPEFESGFRTIHIIDKSRIYKPHTDSTDYLHYRPLDIDVWYPTNRSGADTVLLFRNILGLLDKRANYYTASNAGNGMSEQIAQLFCTGFNCSDSIKLLNFKTKSLKDAFAADGKFPLVIYLSAFNGMSYENYTLFEDLARKGYVVASISSIGRFPGDMTMKNEDLMEQVNDAKVALSSLAQGPNIDSSKIALIGYSWGGLAASVLASKISNVSCLVSLDGSEFHHYDQSKDENKDFDSIRNSNEFNVMRLRVPYLRLESSQNNKIEKVDSVYNFNEKLLSEREIYRIDSAQHEDFSCLSWIVRKSGNCQTNERYNTVSKLTISFIEDHVKGTQTFLQIVNQELNKTIYRK
jgi:pimeloyl-ACP methyl ester carboxylesterase